MRNPSGNGASATLFERTVMRARVRNCRTDWRGRPADPEKDFIYARVIAMNSSPETTAHPTLGAPRVHIVDDDRTILELITKVVRSAGLEPVAHEDAAAFLKSVDPKEYACAILDLVMPETSGLLVLREMQSRGALIPVVMVSGQGSIPTALEAMRSGAVDFLEKPFRVHELLERVHRALEVARDLHARAERVDTIRKRLEGLTPREAELMPFFCAGDSVKKIAFNFDLSPKTVQVHRARILERMGVTSVVELANVVHEMDSSAEPLMRAQELT